VARIIVLVVLVAASISVPAAQSDLDALMARVLARRDDNWKKLQQYVLEERETLSVTGPDGRRLFGTRREYLWFPRPSTSPGAGVIFIKSPLTADGVTIGEEQRRRAEALWMAREEARAKRRAEGGERAEQPRGEISIGPGGVTVALETAMRDAMEPGFVSAAYFLNFKFEQGKYALAGRETFDGKDVLLIEYYPTLMFTEGRTRPNREIRKRDKEVERKMNKVALVTMWVEPADAQIVKYDFRNIDTDFLPAQWLMRLDGLNAAMEMGQPFPNVWLPRKIEIGFDLTLATGEVDGRYSSEFSDYRLASVDTRLRQ
jgi:hypothetical protein